MQLVKLRELRQSAAKAIIARAERVLNQPDATAEERSEAIEDLALDKFENQRSRFEKLLAEDGANANRAAALATLAQYDSPEVPKLVLAQWPKMTPVEKSKVADLLLRVPGLSRWWSICRRKTSELLCS